MIILFIIIIIIIIDTFVCYWYLVTLLSVLFREGTGIHFILLL